MVWKTKFPCFRSLAVSQMFTHLSEFENQLFSLNQNLLCLSSDRAVSSGEYREGTGAVVFGSLILFCVYTCMFFVHNFKFFWRPSQNVEWRKIVFFQLKDYG